MKKVLKRKVHPDLEVKNHKGEDEEVNNEAGNIIDNNMNEGSDSSYFLPILRYVVALNSSLMQCPFYIFHLFVVEALWIKN